MDIRENQIENIINCLNSGNLAIVPTETVYGIIADATKTSAIQKIYDIKKRDKNKPLQVFLKSKDEIKKYAHIGKNATRVIASLLPGQLTIILKSKPSEISHLVNNTNKTIGFRVPDSDIIREISNHFNKPIAATSANFSGQSASSTFQKLDKQLLNNVCGYINADNSQNGIASTVIDLTQDNNPKILRTGKITEQKINEIISKF